MPQPWNEGSGQHVTVSTTEPTYFFPSALLFKEGERLVGNQCPSQGRGKGDLKNENGYACHPLSEPVT